MRRMKLTGNRTSERFTTRSLSEGDVAVLTEGCRKDVIVQRWKNDLIILGDSDGWPGYFAQSNAGIPCRRLVDGEEIALATT